MKLMFATEPTPIIPMVVNGLETLMVFDHTERVIVLSILDGLVEHYEDNDKDSFFYQLVAIRNSVERTMRRKN